MSRKLLVIAMSVALVGLAAAGGGVCAPAQTAATPNAVLVELFTSEGCSDCPPADALLQQMDGKLSPTGQTVIALSEHVTYWNHDGWLDPFSQEIFTQRQKVYGDRFALDDVFTPQMVINGDQQAVGGNSATILKALAAQTSAPKATVKIVSVVADGKMLKVTFALSGELPKQGADIFAAVAENHVSSSVNRGENSGRTLTHVAVVRTLTKVATLKNAAGMTVKVPLGGGPAGAPRHLVVFAQTAGLGKVLSVATVPL